ncbi:hypothetical protein GCM10007190_10390 [Macrococcus hajekii]|uniref:nuclease-related domain-containing protein n=1 Tax=Macrococcus hajekii TaxID=198482 RepID=UPI00140AC730|nr:nuclease-related domain-containing protein [Macrococcus hajekii]GGB04282.1 hypothetical protein GCM10007190_10390 [Macrococcus hajekii]
MDHILLEMELLYARGVEVSMNQLAKERKGHAGERMVKESLEKIVEFSYTLSDILREFEGTFVQSDFIIVHFNRLAILEVKNHCRNYELKNDEWYFSNGHKGSNPFHQLDRAKGLLAKFLKSKDICIPVWGYIVRTNEVSKL